MTKHDLGDSASTRESVFPGGESIPGTDLPINASLGETQDNLRFQRSFVCHMCAGVERLDGRIFRTIKIRLRRYRLSIFH